MLFKNHLLILLSSISIGVFGQAVKTFVFIGTYTNGQPDKGIYVYSLNSRNGKLKKVFSGKGITNPSYITLSPNGDFLYACTETKMPINGSVSAFSIDTSRGVLTFLNKQSSHGANPVYVSCSANNEHLVVANYTEGNIAVFKTNSDGSLNPASQIVPFHGGGPNANRQDKAHIHAAVFSPDFRYVFCPDLGSDRIRVFQCASNDTQTLKPVADDDYLASLGSGPRHFIFHPNGVFAYCIEELSGTVTAFDYLNGHLDSIQRVFAYSKKQDEYNSADIHISPDGLFLYASNRWDQENTLAIFAIDHVTGKLTLIGHQSTLGDHPRNFAIDVQGDFLIVANQVTNNIVVFRRNKQTGLLTKIRQEIKVPSPSCVQIRTYRN
jgi:6-phosphogluconolactonase (cycloisomerase 2 family)